MEDGGNLMVGSKAGGDQREKGNEKRAHRGGQQNLMNARNFRTSNSDGVFGSDSCSRLR